MLRRGQQLYVEGELQYGQYEKDGVTVYTTDIIVQQFSFVGNKNSNSGDGNQNQGQNQGGGPAQDDDSDIPF